MSVTCPNGDSVSATSRSSAALHGSTSRQLIHGYATTLKREWRRRSLLIAWLVGACPARCAYHPRVGEECNEQPLGSH